MHQYYIRAKLGKHTFQALQYRRCHIAQVLTRLHDIQVIIWRNGEQPHYLIEHLPMLAGNTYLCVKTLIRRQRECQRSHFDGFWTRTKNTKRFHSKHSFNQCDAAILQKTDGVNRVCPNRWSRCFGLNRHRFLPLPTPMSTRLWPDALEQS
ncbi:hypothetical protein D3C79_938490 [compost metagenome]